MSSANKFFEESNYVFIFILLVISLLLYVQLSKDDFLRGPDAYYYALQADYWATTGEVKIPDSSFLHRVNGQLQRFGMKTESAIRTWVVLSLFLLCSVTVYLFRTMSLLVTSVVVGWLLLSPSLLFVAIEFPKLFAFLILSPIFLYFLKRSPPHNLYAVIPLGLALFVHKAAIPIVGLLSGFLFLENYKLFLRNQRNLIIAIGLSISFIALYFLLGDHFHVLDLARIGGWNNLSPGIVTLLNRDALPIAIKFEIAITLISFVSILVWYIKTQKVRKSAIAYCFALLLPGFFPFSSNEVFGIGERYAIFLPYFFVLSSLLLLSLSQLNISAQKLPIYAGIIIIAAVSMTSRLSYSHPERLDPDNATYEKVTSIISDYEIPMLIVHRGFNFYYKFKTHKESFLYEPELHWDKKLIWRLIYKISPDELNYFLNPACGWDSGLIKNVGDNDYFLIREDCWVNFRSDIKEDDNQYLYERVWLWWKNPSKTRPKFLYRKHQSDKKQKDDVFSTFKD